VLLSDPMLFTCALNRPKYYLSFRYSVSKSNTFLYAISLCLSF
jgi:hypothetical protein